MGAGAWRNKNVIMQVRCQVSAGLDVSFYKMMQFMNLAGRNEEEGKLCGGKLLRQGNSARQS
jgi:hypothetical protein